ncbi:MAG: hypothetical protein ACFFD7_02485 [Candidatus Thorarchaeota archaeon]
MKNRKLISINLIFFVLITSLFGIIVSHYDISNNISSRNDNGALPYNLEMSNDPPLAYWAIIRNTTTVHRLFESINISINTFGFDVDYAVIEIKFTNRTTNNYNMISGGINEYYFEYKPLYNDPLGLQNVSFYLYNSTDTLQNSHTTYTNFTTISNYMLTTNSSGYYIGEELYAELIVNNFGSFQFGWNLTIVDSIIESSQKNIFNLENNAVQFTYRISNETFNNYVGQKFYIKLNMTNKTSGFKAAAYFPFDVLNSNPIIDELSIVFSPSQILRTEQCEISLNVSDVEDASKDLDINMNIKDPEGTFVATLTLNYNIDNNFSKQFTIAAEKPIGKYQITIIAEDQDGGESSYETSLIVKNNPPEIHSYEINGLSMSEAISVLYGVLLTFTFNVSDVEGVAYIKVALIDENNEWYNITRVYDDENTEITIRTIDLITGVWYVYIYVTDSDGTTINLINDYNLAPQSIRIIPDVISDFIPWISFIIGTILGILVGIGLVYRHYKSRFIETQAVSPKEKISEKKREKKESPKFQKESEEILEERKLEKEPEEETIPKRKIKRKL